MRSLIIFLFVISSCAPVRFVKPLVKKEQAVNLSLGGALINYSDLVIPLPLLTAAYGYGIDGTLTGFGSVHITSALYGNVQAELGVTKRVGQQKGRVPGLSTTPVANIVYRNKDAFVFYPQLDINAYWDFSSFTFSDPEACRLIVFSPYHPVL